MFLVALGVLILASVPMAGGRLSRLADIELHGAAFIFSSLAIQVLITTVLPGGSPVAHRVLHLVSYLLAGAFLVANRHLPGLMFIALGALANAVAIFANNGVMPATLGALRAAGEPISTKTFLNSTLLAHPRVSFLGDIFAIPKAWPFHNVFSVGDVCIAVGAIIAIHTLCGSHLSVRRPRLGERTDQDARDLQQV